MFRRLFPNVFEINPSFCVHLSFKKFRINTLAMGQNIIFSEIELDVIKNRIIECEKEISGEIRVAIERSSDAYRGASMWGAISIMWVVTLIYFAVEELFFKNSFHKIFHVNYLILIQLCSFIGGYFITSFSNGLKRFFTPASMRKKAVFEKAETVFLEKEIFATRQRSGVLIFLSLLEREVVIMPDIGLKAKVKQQEWNNIAKSISAGIQHKHSADGVLKAIEQCRDILLKNGFTAGPEDANELSNEIILPKK